jgi:peptidoglycan hydrolase-like protein with peptidoglycan-binding domain
VHVSVLSTAAADSPTSWSLSSTGAKYPSHGHQVVRLGSHGDDVAYLQRFLGGLAIDGDFGKATLAAVNRYQRVNGLSVDGVVGPETWGHIATAVAAGHVTAYGH